jgi:hypothetical protein
MTGFWLNELRLIIAEPMLCWLGAANTLVWLVTSEVIKTSMLISAIRRFDFMLSSLRDYLMA